MKLKKWRPVVENGDMPGKYLSIAVKVECSICHATKTIKTEGHNVYGERKMLLEWKINDLLEPVACPNCGVLSTFPEKDMARLIAEINAKITREWLREADE